MLIPEPGKIPPDRPVRNKCMTIKGVRENSFADCLRFLHGLVCEAVPLPGRPVTFDQKRAHRFRIAIVMSIEDAEVRFDECLRERFKSFASAVPCKFVARICKGRSEIAFERAAH